jgi:uncharacterized membrane protein YagU involved in acid resistance
VNISLIRGSAGAAGAVAGVAGGLVFGAAMASYGALPTVASIVRADSPVVGFVVHMAIAAVIGAGFGLLVTHQHAQVSETVFWGLIYGAFWWFLGPQTILPLLLGNPVAWDLRGAQALFPSLVGHLYYGATTAVVFVALRRDRAAVRRPRVRSLLRGVAAGLITTAVLYLVIDVMLGSALGWLFGVGALVGLGYPLLFTAHPEPTGPALVRGTLYGFGWWVLAGLTLPPLVRGGTLDWSQAAARAAAGELPAYLLLGAGTALVFSWLGAVRRGLFEDDVRMFRHESPGGRGLRALGYGALAGLVGGLVFTVVMVLVDALPVVARMVGAQGAISGLVVHLVIAQIIGVSYAVLFRHRSFDLASGIGWGVCYGFLWWVLGNLTLLPLLTGGSLAWNAAGIAAGFPSLVGHLGYGAALGMVYFRLESRADPWWFTRSEAEAERVAARREQTLGSAPALWGLTVLVAVTVPVLVGAG